MEDNKLDKEAEVKVEATEKTVETTNTENKSDGGEYTPNIDLDIESKPAEITNELKEEDVFSFLSKRTGKEIKSIEDLTIEKEIIKNVDYADEQVAIIDKYVRETGRSPKDWFTTQATDYSAMSSEQLIKEDLRAQYPEATIEQINAYFENEYHLDEDTYDEKEISIAQMKLQGKSKEILKKITDIQEKFRKPIEKKEEATAKSPEANSLELERQKQKAAWIEERKKEINALEKLSVGKYEVAVDDDIKKSLIKANSNLEGFFVDHFVKDGAWDKDKLNTFILLAQDGMLEKAIGNIESNLIAQGMDSVIENRKNLNLSTSNRTSSSDTPEQAAEKQAMRDAIAAGFGLTVKN